MRRNRMTAFSRRLVAETRLDTADLIWPLFVIEGQNMAEPIDAMPGVFRYSIDQLLQQAAKAVELTIPAIAIFPSIDAALKDASGSLARDGDNLVCRAVSAVKAAFPDLGIICDVALDPFTSHGHDGLLDGDEILNDETIAVLCEQAVHQANAGCDIIAPSDMMDGRVGEIRDAVRAGASLGKAGKSTYQMDPANSDEAMHEIALDLAEGADMVIVKPGMPYLDILARAKAEFGVPCIAYQVSGEYSMLCASFEKGWLDRERTILEAMTCFKRAGADAVLTYFAPEIAMMIRR
jgi:porphobilinogen synthase